MTKTKSLLFTASIAFATAFTLSCSSDDSGKDDTPPDGLLAVCYSTSPPIGDAFCIEFFDEAIFNMVGGTPEAFCQFMGERKDVLMTPRESCPKSPTPLRCPQTSPEATLYLYGAPAGFKCEDLDDD